MNDDKLFGVKLQLGAQDFLDNYKLCFESLFGGPPILDIVNSMEISRWAVGTFGNVRAIELVQAYFRYNNDWIKKQAYPLSLFKSKINEVIAFESCEPKKDGSSHTQKKRLEVVLACDSCWTNFKCSIFKINYDNVFIRCKDCLEKNAPWKYPTEEEFNQKWENLKGLVNSGGSFSYSNIFKVKDPYPAGFEPLLCDYIDGPIVEKPWIKEGTKFRRP